MSKVVIYHANCYDGVTAAYVCWLMYGLDPNIEFVPANYSDPPPDVKGKEVIIVDFSYKRPVMEEILKDCQTLLVLDHHKTAEAELKDMQGGIIIFDMNKSGAGLALDFFYPKLSDATPLYQLVQYVQDRDLWRFKLPNSKEVNAWIQSFDIDLQTWIDKVVPNFTVPRAYSEGISLLRLENKYVKQICKNARLKSLFLPETTGPKILNANMYTGPFVDTSILMSECCDYMIKEFDSQFAWYHFYRKDGKHQYGLRSRSDFDVSIIAKEFGGGGHKQAAGFELDYEL